MIWLILIPILSVFATLICLSACAMLSHSNLWAVNSAGSSVVFQGTAPEPGTYGLASLINSQHGQAGSNPAPSNILILSLLASGVLRKI